MGSAHDDDLWYGQREHERHRKAERNMAIRASILAALGHHKPNYRSVGRLDESAKIIANFVVGALDELELKREER